jgi:hypothetical protein
MLTWFSAVPRRQAIGLGTLLARPAREEGTPMATGEGARDEIALPAPILRCTVCGSVVYTCTLCGTGLLTDQALRCRRDDGHEHEACAVARMRRSPTDNPRAPNPAERMKAEPLPKKRERLQSGFQSRRRG